MNSKVKCDIIYLKQFVRYLHEIFCVIFCHLFCVIFCEICREILLFIISRNIFLKYISWIFHIFHIFHTRTEYFNNSTYFIILHCFCTLYFTATVCRWTRDRVRQESGGLWVRVAAAVCRFSRPARQWHWAANGSPMYFVNSWALQ